MKSSVFYSVLTCALAFCNTVMADEFEATEDTFLVDAAISDAELQNNRGEGVDPLVIDKINMNTMDLDAIHEGNTAANNTTGNNILDHGAFTDAQGFPTAIQNSGNNVLIQNAILLNVTIEN